MVLVHPLGIIDLAFQEVLPLALPLQLARRAEDGPAHDAQGGLRLVVKEAAVVVAGEIINVVLLRGTKCNQFGAQI